jgi:hypothetical protein
MHEHGNRGRTKLPRCLFDADLDRFPHGDSFPSPENEKPAGGDLPAGFIA